MVYWLFLTSSHETVIKRRTFLVFYFSIYIVFFLFHYYNYYPNRFLFLMFYLIIYILGCKYLLYNLINFHLFDDFLKEINIFYTNYYIFLFLIRFERCKLGAKKRKQNTKSKGEIVINCSLI